MKAFPMFIKTTGRRVIIVGGGEQAAQKARLILKTDAQIIFAAPELDDELQMIVDEGRAEQYDGPLTEAFFAGAAMVFVASGCFAVDVSAHAVAQAARCPVNVVDQPELCDITTPSLVDRDPVVIAIGTEGTGPVLARQIKTRLEEQLPQNLGGLAALAGRLRASVAANVPRAGRRAFWRWVFAAEPMEMWARGAEAHAARAVKDAIAAGGAPDAVVEGSVAFVGAQPGARDLLSLRAVQRLQEADVIYYEGEVGDDVLELARRDAERVAVTPEPAASPWPSSSALALVKSAREGLRVVHLGVSDPCTCSETLRGFDAVERAGVAAEVVPAAFEMSARASALREGVGG
ncbi:MAG: NAD(P)-dependent oxidoreductase [Pseudomonadota bacterium]